jgi:NAD(P)-dependent dehydrogenase (short-subunit alcohol dehydrogenase family)
MKRLKIFDNEGQTAFAELSGDFNPLHCDPVAARRLLAGKPVVHGIHEVLWALDEWLEARSRPIELLSLNVRFEHALTIGQPVSCLVSEDGEQASLAVSTAGKRTVAMDIHWHDGRADADAAIDSEHPQGGTPLNLSPEHAIDARGEIRLSLDRTAGRRLFPNLMRCLPASQIAAIAATSRIVGMECPGMHSVFIGLNLDFETPEVNNSNLAYKTTKFDDRFGKVELAVTGTGANGTIEAIFRQPPVDQASAATLKDMIQTSEFQDRRALIVGGSRGLGEVAAKLLALGGAEVDLTYRLGEHDARHVVEQITEAGGSARCRKFDVAAGPRSLLDAIQDAPAPSHVYYFATPPIAKGKRNEFDPVLFGAYTDIYTTGYFNLIAGLAGLGKDKIRILYPSTVYLDEMPAGFAEYTAAKAAGEALGPFLEKLFGNIQVQTVRLPMMSTDQTSGVAKRYLADPVEVLLAALRQDT